MSLEFVQLRYGHLYVLSGAEDGHCDTQTKTGRWTIDHFFATVLLGHTNISRTGGPESGTVASRTGRMGAPASRSCGLGYGGFMDAMDDLSAPRNRPKGAYSPFCRRPWFTKGYGTCRRYHILQWICIMMLFHVGRVTRSIETPISEHASYFPGHFS